jgi:hypothetical protein
MTLLAGVFMAKLCEEDETPPFENWVLDSAIGFLFKYSINKIKDLPSPHFKKHLRQWWGNKNYSVCIF